jgi:hypothetical protein
MEVDQKQIDEIMSDELAPTAYEESVLVPKLESIAELKGLRVFVFKGDTLKEYFSNVNPDLGIALMAKSEESARWNLQNFRKCYLIKLST